MVMYSFHSTGGRVESNEELIGLLNKQLAPPGVKWANHIHYTGSCIALTFLFTKPATNGDLLGNPSAAGT